MCRGGRDNGKFTAQSKSCSILCYCIVIHFKLEVFEIQVQFDNYQICLFYTLSALVELVAP